MAQIDSMNQLSDVQTLIDGAVRESEILEYKTASVPFGDRDKAEIAKDVSAMANSGGGTIVYGISTCGDDKTKPSQIERLHIKNIETFDRVLNSQVKPPIRGLRKKLIPQDDPQVMVIDVPESDNPPHQSLYDKKYYRRSGTESLPMEHDLVALYFGRRTGPVLSLIFQPSGRPSGFAGEPLFSNDVSLRILVENAGKRVGKYVEVILLFPKAEHVKPRLANINWVDIGALYPGTGTRAYQFSENVGVFHPKMVKSILDMTFSISKEYLDKFGGDPFLMWKIYADEMDPRDGIISLRGLGFA